jgi:hypothetical protein
MSETLETILARLSDLDNAQVDVEFDPAEVVGELAQKVDAIKTVIDRLEKESERLDEAATSFAMASSAVKNNAKRLRNYVQYSMQSHGFEKLPGTLWRMQLQNSAPALKTTKDPDAENAVYMPEFVRRKVIYSWDKDAIKESLAKGASFEYGSLVESKQLRFYVQKGGK